jgi:hypothetical protein
MCRAKLIEPKEAGYEGAARWGAPAMSLCAQTSIWKIRKLITTVCTRKKTA